MDITPTMKEDLVSNALLGLGILLYYTLRDLCKRVSHSDCSYDNEHGGLKIKLPTWRGDDDEKGNSIV